MIRIAKFWVLGLVILAQAISAQEPAPDDRPKALDAIIEHLKKRAESKPEMPSSDSPHKRDTASDEINFRITSTADRVVREMLRSILEVHSKRLSELQQSLKDCEQRLQQIRREGVERANRLKGITDKHAYQRAVLELESEVRAAEKAYEVEIAAIKEQIAAQTARKAVIEQALEPYQLGGSPSNGGASSKKLLENAARASEGFFDSLMKPSPSRDTK